MLRIPWLLFVILATVNSENKEKQDNAVRTGVQSGQDQSLSSSPASASLRHTRCYACTDCQTVSYNTTVKNCPYDPDQTKMHKCITYEEKYKYVDKPWYIRGCASERGTCIEIRKAHEANGSPLILSSCNECDGDKCNGVSRSLPMAFLAMVMTPILAKLV